MELLSQVQQIFQVLQQQIGGVLGATVQNLLTSLQTQLLGKRAIDMEKLGQLTSQLQGLVQNLQGNLQGVFNTLLGNIQSFLTSVNKPQGAEKLRLEVVDANNKIIDAITNAFNQAVNVIIAAGINVGQWLGIIGKRGIFDGINGLLNQLTTTVTGVVNNIGSTLGQLGTSIGTAVAPHLQDLQDQLTNHALNAATSLLGTLSNISGTLQG